MFHFVFTPTAGMTITTTTAHLTCPRPAGGVAGAEPGVATPTLRTITDTMNITTTTATITTITGAATTTRTSATKTSSRRRHPVEAVVGSGAEPEGEWLRREAEEVLGLRVAGRAFPSAEEAEAAGGRGAESEEEGRRRGSAGYVVRGVDAVEI